MTQDGYDWPNGHHDEQCWPLEKAQPMAPYFRNAEQLKAAWLESDLWLTEHAEFLEAFRAMLREREQISHHHG